MQPKEIIEKILNDLKKTGDIEACAAVSRDGFLICSTMSENQYAQTVMALSATMLGAAEIATSELGKGTPERIIVESELGKIITTGAGSEVLLVTITSPDANTGLILIEMTKALDQIKQLLYESC